MKQGNIRLSCGGSHWVILVNSTLQMWQHARRRGSIVVEVEGMVVRRRLRKDGSESGGGGGSGGGLCGGPLARRRAEVELSPRSVQHGGGSVVGSSGVLCGGEGPQPLPRPLPWLSYLGNPFAPAALPYTSVSEFVVVWATLALALPSPALAAAFATVCSGGVGRRGGAAAA